MRTNLHSFYEQELNRLARSKKLQLEAGMYDSNSRGEYLNPNASAFIASMERHEITLKNLLNQH